MSAPIILDCTPALADVVSGAVPRPRERRAREKPFRWLVDATPAWPRVLAHFGIGERDQWPGVEYQPDMKPPVSLGLDAFTHVYTLAWHNPPKSGAALLLVNEDGTRCAILDAWDELKRLWDKIGRPAAGRPRESQVKPGSIYQRERRERLKKISRD